MKQLNIELNGKTVEAQEGETVLQVAKREGVEIPTLCNDPRLEPFSSCYLCVVEVEGMRGHQPSCSTKVNEGMKVVTDNDSIHASRKTALDLIMSNHYADCQAPCTQTCPAGVDVQGYISLIEKERYSDAVELIKETNPLPAICGRVCVRPCEAACRRNLLDEGAPVGIDYMKRFASDYDLMSENKFIPEVLPSTGKKIAVIGAGPGGLSAAHFLQIKGHQVDIFEAAPKSGGWLRYGIPEYRLPNDVLDAEVKNITDLGATITYNQKLGSDISYEQIKKDYNSTILTIGSQKGTLIGTEGDDAQNVFSGIDFLKNMEMTGQKLDLSGKTVAVVGGGNTAMDCCRTAVRCGAEKVYVIYRRTEAEMPANPIEIHESKLEGVEYLFLSNPKKVNKDDNGVLKSVTMLKMELGEPDASGRRRPMAVEGSDYELNLDYILAAIGQKTEADFIDDINKFADGGKLELNRWGNIDANEETLQTGIPSVFAAGDGVTGAATIIEAIAQAKTASESCHQYLTGQEIKVAKPEFLSKKDNFKAQETKEYAGKFALQHRQEMPVLNADDRFNFEEVELGYASEEVCKSEAARCLECGCVEYYDCDLKKYSTEYEADQKKYAGDYHEHQVDFRHPFIEIDNNKCILCARCVRICDEVVGAGALGLVNRGFDTVVAPSMGLSLLDTTCESCGLCISTCPTGAISENFRHKPGPVVEYSAETICNFCSVGCTINIKHHNEFVMKVVGAEGQINADGNICQMAKFGYDYLNDSSRIVKPRKKLDNGKFAEITWNEAYALIKENVSKVKADENLFTIGARYSNEEMYMLQKIARAGVKTNNVGSFSNFGKSAYFQNISEANVPFNQIKETETVYILGDDITKTHPVVSYKIHNAHKINKVNVELIASENSIDLDYKYTAKTEIKSYYNFFKAVNHYIMFKGEENMLFINDRVKGFDAYKTEALKEDFATLVDKSGVENEKIISKFAKKYLNEQRNIIVFAEQNIDGATAQEIKNLALISGKLSKIANGIIALKDKNNSHGLIDMGIDSALATGAKQCVSSVEKMQNVWGVDGLNTEVNNVEELLAEGKLKNAFIFGEDPIGNVAGSLADKEVVLKQISELDFVVVQDYFMTETAQQADVILPASFAPENSGSYTNTQKYIQTFEAKFSTKTEKVNITQLFDIAKQFGINGLNDAGDVNIEIVKFLDNKPDAKFELLSTKAENIKQKFNYSCDVVERRFAEKFYKAIEW
ncbi:MAG: FAD-dependent oxidoreductase [Ichthyobacteriaceae bacterium]|nr:FAD-dependent oxidoreductase [Ichthyobacteriaceae bacterium]